MALLSKTERLMLRLLLQDPNTDSQRGSILRELQRDDDSMAEDSVDSKMGLARKE